MPAQRFINSFFAENSELRFNQYKYSTINHCRCGSLCHRNQGESHGNEIQPRKALRKRTEGAQTRRRTRTQDQPGAHDCGRDERTSGRGPENCKKARPACQRNIEQEKKKPQFPCTAEVSEPERSQPDLVRPRTPARMVQRGKRQRQVSQEPRNLKLRIGRHCLPPFFHLGIEISAFRPPKSLLSESDKVPPCCRAASAAIDRPSPTPKPTS